MSRKPAATSGSVVAIANLRNVAACSARYFLPGKIWFPVTTRYTISRTRCDYALQRNPFRGNRIKVYLRRAHGGVIGAFGHLEARRNRQWGGSRGELPLAMSVLAREFPGFLVDEMKPAAGEADDRTGIGTGFVPRRGRRLLTRHVYLGACRPGEESHSLMCAAVSACRASRMSRSRAMPGGVSRASVRRRSACSVKR